MGIAQPQRKTFPPDQMRKGMVLYDYKAPPDDIIVADGDGVMVVPREHMDEVLKIALGFVGADKAGRRNSYERLKKSLDSTVK